MPRRDRRETRSGLDQRYGAPGGRVGGRHMVLIVHFAPTLARTKVRHRHVAVDLGNHLGQLDLVGDRLAPLQERRPPPHPPRGAAMAPSPSTSAITSVSSILSAIGSNSSKIAAPPITEIGGDPAAAIALSTSWNTSTPSTFQFGWWVMTICCRPGRMPGRLSKVLRPMIIALPMVSCLKRLRSPGMCQGSTPSLPITPLMARARTIVIGGRAMGWTLPHGHGFAKP